MTASAGRVPASYFEGFTLYHQRPRPSIASIFASRSSDAGGRDDQVAVIPARHLAATAQFISGHRREGAAAGKSLGFSKALRTASRSDPLRSWATIFPSGPIRNVTGILR